LKDSSKPSSSDVFGQTFPSKYLDVSSCPNPCDSDRGQLTLDRPLVSHPKHQDNREVDWHNKIPCINPVSTRQPPPVPEGWTLRHSSFPDHDSTQRDNEYQVFPDPSSPRPS
jgi:hypothetical protein